MRDDISNEYFKWLYDLVCSDRYSEHISYRKLLMYLHSTPFVYSIQNDDNRAADGVDMRYRFTNNGDLPKELCGPCSVLEMMIALAVRCEETIANDTDYGDRTGQWFWGMIVNLGLGSMTDEYFDKSYVKDAVDRFLNREYEPNGKGGLFTIRDCNRDLRTVEIWYQLCWYLNTIL